MNLYRDRPLLFYSLIFYGLFLAAALLYFRFPAERFKLFCQTRVEQLLPGTECSISQINYRFPFHMDIEDIQVSSKLDEGQNILSIDLVTIRPKLSAPGSHFTIDVKAYDGDHSFSLLLNKDKKTISVEDIKLANLNLAKIPFLRQTFKREITGSLSGNGTYHTTWNSALSAGNGKGSIMITDGNFKLLFPILSLQQIDLERFDADLVLRDKNLHFNRGYFQGKELKGEFSGALEIQQPIGHSGLSFEGTLEPLAPLLRKNRYAKTMVLQLKRRHKRPILPFLLQGSMERPKFKFDS